MKSAAFTKSYESNPVLTMPAADWDPGTIYAVIGPNGNELFLPATGYRYNSSLYYSYFEGHYWSRDLYDIHPDCAYRLRIAEGVRNCNVYNRYFGYAVRAVRVTQN